MKEATATNALSVARRELKKWYDGDFDNVLPRPELERLLDGGSPVVAREGDMEVCPSCGTVLGIVEQDD